MLVLSTAIVRLTLMFRCTMCCVVPTACVNLVVCAHNCSVSVSQQVVSLCFAVLQPKEGRKDASCWSRRIFSSCLQQLNLLRRIEMTMMLGISRKSYCNTRVFYMHAFDSPLLQPKCHPRSLTGLGRTLRSNTLSTQLVHVSHVVNPSLLSNELRSINNSKMVVYFSHIGKKRGGTAPDPCS